jgi:hypothetical protein
MRQDAFTRLPRRVPSTEWIAVSTRDERRVSGKGRPLSLGEDDLIADDAHVVGRDLLQLLDEDEGFFGF